MSNNDNEQQRMVEDGKTQGSEDRDIIAYTRLFEILNERQTQMSTGLEERVILRIAGVRERSSIVDHLWLISGVVFMVIVGIAAIAASGFRIPLSGWQWNILALAICAGVMIVLFNTIERRILKR